MQVVTDTLNINKGLHENTPKRLGWLRTSCSVDITEVYSAPLTG